MMDYWKECISEALDDAGVKATEEQIKNIAWWIEGAHENYGMAFGHDCIPNPVDLENKRLTKELQEEKDRVFCRECNGSGRIISHGPSHSSNSECSRCRGAGKHKP